jgi:hypothetical protein
MLGCAHDTIPFGPPICSHLRECRKPWIRYFKWYTGVEMNTELLCDECTSYREMGLTIETARVCKECFEFATEEVGYLEGVRGKPEVRVRLEAMHAELLETPLPDDIRRILDIAPIEFGDASVWLTLNQSGAIFRFNADTSECVQISSVEIPSEPNHKPWCGHTLKTRLHCSHDGRFAAVVNDYGNLGRLVDLPSGKVIRELNSGSYHSDTVPFSFAFVNDDKRTLAIHRTDWNRLDITDPVSVMLVSERSPTSFRSGEPCPEHYLDYFHGAIFVSPDGKSILDDGWVWSPDGIPVIWNIRRWIEDNVWESEDGPTRKTIAMRHYYWGGAMAWVDERRIAIFGIGDDELEMIDGARIFDAAVPSDKPSPYRCQSVKELLSFAGPRGLFFSDGKSLFSSDETGLSRWSLSDGARTGQIPGFRPTHHHKAANELVEIAGGTFRRWNLAGESAV